MLVIGRHAGEAVLIGGDITVVVVAVKSDGSVSLGIEAPRSVNIVREELVRDQTHEARRPKREDDWGKR